MALVHARAQLKFLFLYCLQISQQNSVTEEEEEEELFLIQRRQLLNIFFFAIHVNLRIRFPHTRTEATTTTTN